MNTSSQQATLETERLRLRVPRLDDAGRVQELLSDGRVAEMLARVPYPYPENGAREWIERVRVGDEPIFVIALRESDEAIGALGISTSRQGMCADFRSARGNSWSFVGIPKIRD